jgi:hypothetical protein
MPSAWREDPAEGISSGGPGRRRISDAIKDKLAAAPCTKAAKGSLTVHVTMEADGRVKQIKLATTTGNPKVDECIDSALTSVTSIGEPVPPGMPAQVNLKIVART